MASQIDPLAIIHEETFAQHVGWSVTMTLHLNRLGISWLLAVGLLASAVSVCRAQVRTPNIRVIPEVPDIPIRERLLPDDDVVVLNRTTDDGVVIVGHPTLSSFIEVQRLTAGAASLPRSCV